jgi:hypothetical protein
MQISNKTVSIIWILVFLIACSSNKNENNNSDNNSDTLTDFNTGNYSLNEQPVKTIVDFLKWYRVSQSKIGRGMVNNATNETWDSTKFYSVNFEATEKYLLNLKSSGFISEKYIDKWRNYFKKCDQDFKANPSNDGPPDGFDYDLVMLSQEEEQPLKTIENAKVISQSILNNNATIKMYFPSGDKYIYRLTKSVGKWEIDDIERL